MAPGSARGQNFWFFEFPHLVLGQSQLVYRILRFHDTENTLDHILAGVRGPWIRPWMEFLGFRISPFSFREIPIIIPNFTLLIPGSTLDHISPGVRGPCIRPWT